MKDYQEESQTAEAECLKLHLHRGLGYLTSGNDRQDIKSLFVRISSKRIFRMQ